MEIDVLFSDLRYIDCYMTPMEKEDWKNNNILYNSIWFYLNKGYDIEYGDKAIESYKILNPYKNLQYIYHGTNGKVLLIEGQIFNADLMTGWWNPFKYCFLEDTGKSRKDICKDLISKIPKDKENIVEKLISYRKSKTKEIRNDEEIQEILKTLVSSFIDFLKVIYSEGNIIPAPKNWIGRGLDNWCYKLTSIYRKDSTNQVKCWSEYIKKNKNFIQDNLLEMYFKEDCLEVISLENIWGGKIPNSFESATNKQWINYFSKMRELIKNRTDRITEMKVKRNDK